MAKHPHRQQREDKNDGPPAIATQDDIAAVRAEIEEIGSLKSTIANLQAMVTQQTAALENVTAGPTAEAAAAIDTYAKTAARLEARLEKIESPSEGQTIKMADELGVAQDREYIVKFLNGEPDIWDVFVESQRGFVALKKDKKIRDSDGDVVEMEGAIILHFKPWNRVGSEIPNPDPNKPGRRMLNWGYCDMRTHAQIGPGKSISYEEAFERLSRAPLYKAGYYMNGHLMRAKLRGVYQEMWMVQQIRDVTAKQVEGLTHHQVKAGQFAAQGQIAPAASMTPLDDLLKTMAGQTAPSGSVPTSVPAVPQPAPTIESENPEPVTVRADIGAPDSGADDIDV